MIYNQSRVLFDLLDLESAGSRIPVPSKVIMRLSDVQER